MSTVLKLRPLFSPTPIAFELKGTVKVETALAAVNAVLRQLPERINAYEFQLLDVSSGSSRLPQNMMSSALNESILGEVSSDDEPTVPMLPALTPKTSSPLTPLAPEKKRPRLTLVHSRS